MMAAARFPEGRVFEVLRYWTLPLRPGPLARRDQPGQAVVQGLKIRETPPQVGDLLLSQGSAPVAAIRAALGQIEQRRDLRQAETGILGSPDEPAAPPPPDRPDIQWATGPA